LPSRYSIMWTMTLALVILMIFQIGSLFILNLDELLALIYSVSTSWVTGSTGMRPSAQLAGKFLLDAKARGEYR
jgi:hypothetical protein